ncbi:MAG: hypothetical protein GY839_11330 [candidate division Zixibacteria bacterium]|nr:hypothetical protein [candidate division Zixibacteria bacterium]
MITEPEEAPYEELGTDDEPAASIQPSSWPDIIDQIRSQIDDRYSGDTKLVLFLLIDKLEKEALKTEDNLDNDNTSDNSDEDSPIELILQQMEDYLEAVEMEAANK